MNTRILIVLALVAILVASWFFYQHGQLDTPIAKPDPQIDFEATQIKAMQANDQGQTEYELIADRFVHNPQTDQDEMADIQMKWQPNADQAYQLVAGLASLDQTSGDMVLSGGFELTTLGTSNLPFENNQLNAQSDQNSPKNQPKNAQKSLKITGNILKGNTKSKKIYSDQPIKIEQNGDEFVAQHFTADLQTGDYQFGVVEMTFLPEKRVDKPLF